MKPTITVLLSVLVFFCVGCSSQTRSFTTPEECENASQATPKEKYDYEESSTEMLYKYPHWGANRIEDGKLVRPQNVPDLHPRPIVGIPQEGISGSSLPSRGATFVRGHMARNPGGSGSHWVRPHTRRR